MANKYFINLPEKTTPEDSNILPIEDAQDTKRMTWANLKTAILGNRTYTEQNVVTNGESITKSIDELDVDLASHKADYASLNVNSYLQNGWVIHSYDVIASKSPNTLTLQGAIKDGVLTKGTLILTLPEGYRPQNRARIPVYAWGNPGSIIWGIVSAYGAVTIDTNQDWPIASSYALNFTISLI